MQSSINFIDLGDDDIELPKRISMDKQCGQNNPMCTVFMPATMSYINAVQCLTLSWSTPEQRGIIVFLEHSADAVWLFFVFVFFLT